MEKDRLAEEAAAVLAALRLADQLRDDNREDLSDLDPEDQLIIRQRQTGWRAGCHWCAIGRSMMVRPAA